MWLTKVSYSSLEKAYPSCSLHFSSRTRHLLVGSFTVKNRCYHVGRRISARAKGAERNRTGHGEVNIGRGGNVANGSCSLSQSQNRCATAFGVSFKSKVDVLLPSISQAHAQARPYSNRRKGHPSSTSPLPPLSSLMEMLKRTDTIFADSFQDCIDIICSSDAESLRFSGTLCENRASILAKALEKNSSLAVLDLKWNDIDDKAATAIAQGLRGNEALVALDLSQNRITCTGAVALAESMVHGQHSSLLYLCENPIADPRSIQAVLEKSDHYVVL